MRGRGNLFLLLCGILATLVPVSATQGFSGAGSGTEQDPYIITNVYQLQEMNDDLDAWYELGNDIDASDTRTWNGGAGFTPIGNDPYPYHFTGHFDGKGHKITGLYISRSSSDFVGLFGINWTGVIKNVGLVNVDVNPVNGECVGGLVGYNDDGTITNCYSTGSVTGNEGVGGLVGLNGGTITNCYSTGSVTGGDRWDLGGLVGLNAGTITNCYATGSATGNKYVGGLVGGNCWYATITNCYCTGSATGNEYVGGMVGYNHKGGKVINSFWDIETSGWVTSAGGTGKTTAEMKRKATFTNWDFDLIWDIIENERYPFLREGPPPIPRLKWPLAGDIGDRQILWDSGFGAIWTRTYCGGLPKRHTGVDLIATEGENVYAPEVGTVHLGQDSQTPHWAYYIVIDHSSFTTVCWHVNPIVSEGEHVDKGQIIGTIADISPDDIHLHFGVRNSPYTLGLSQLGALPQNDCGGYKQFPEKFVDPMTLEYEGAEPLPPPEIAPRPESENPQSGSLAFDAPLVIFPVEPPSWYGEEAWRGVLIRLLDNLITILCWPHWTPTIFWVPIEIEGVQAHNWKGDNATSVTVAVAGTNQTQTDAIKLTETSDAFIWKEVTIPKNAYGLTFDAIFLGDPDGDNLIVSFDDKTLFIDDGALFTDTLWAKPGIIYIGDLAGETGILQFWLKSEGEPNVSILITNITLTIYPQVGDLDRDMDVDLADLSTLNSHWLAKDCNYPDWCEGTDLNYNGFVDFTDFAIFSDNWLWEKIPADFDIDDDVDFVDYAAFPKHWLSVDCNEPDWREGTNFDHSGSVDMLDLATFARYWLEGI